jgi:hypothetical protein
MGSVQNDNLLLCSISMNGWRMAYNFNDFAIEYD